MANTRSSTVTKPPASAQSPAEKARKQRKNTRDVLLKQIKDGRNLEDLGNVQQQLADLDRMDRMEIDDSADGGGASTINPPTQNPTGPKSEGASTTDGQSSLPGADPPDEKLSGEAGGLFVDSPGDGSNKSASNSVPSSVKTFRDELGEICVGLNNLSVNNGTPVSWRKLRSGIGLIVRRGPIQACVYEMQTVGENYPTEGLMPHEELSINEYSFVSAHGAVLYNGKKNMDVKVKMRLKGESRISVHWITRTNFHKFMKGARGMDILRDVWEEQESSYAQENPGYQARSFPALGRRKLSGT